MDTQARIDEMIAKARAAQAIFEKESQERVDEAVKACALAVSRHGQMLAEYAVSETRMGRVKDKLTKHTNKPKIVWWGLKGKKSRGILERDTEQGITLVAKPMGVVGAITPTTNPVVTPMSNAMFSLKAGNAIIIAPHPRSKGCSSKIVSFMREEIGKLGFPEDLIQVIEEPTLEATSHLMQSVDIVIATGGMNMVKAVYSSGKPALGVGAGNVQTILDRDIDYKETIPKIVAGRAFDNGILCTADQYVACPADKIDEVMEEFSKNKAFVLRDAQRVDLFREAIFPNGVFNKDATGQSAAFLGRLAGIDIPEDTEIIVLEAKDYGENDVLAKEKMCPVLAVFKYDSFEEGVKIAKANMEKEGKGHTVSLHSNDNEHIEYAALELSASRFVVNQVCAIAGAGSFQNNLAPTNTLGCGSWGNNSISENLFYKHLMNISRIAYFNKDAYVPTEEELWDSEQTEHLSASYK
jgi:succinate-semialdehyde dehydrogenase